MTISAQCKAAASIQSVVLSWVRTHQPVTITAYVPIGSEPGGPDLPSALHGALPPGGRLLLPVLLNDGDLDWAAFEPIGSPTPLTPGRLGLQEPTGPRLGVDAIRQASLVIVPALAVDPSGHRLGRGGGSYDRALARVSPRTLTVALLHDGELIDAVPAEPHDRHVAATITPHHGLVLSRGAEWTN